jgi:hypothetical protein
MTELKNYTVTKYADTSGNMRYSLVIQTPEGNVERNLHKHEYDDISAAIERHNEYQNQIDKIETEQQPQ